VAKMKRSPRFAAGSLAGLTNLTNPGVARYDRLMAKILNLYEAKTQLSSLVEEAAAGYEIVIAKAGVPRARLVPLRTSARRRPGGSKGRIRIAADFDAPLPPDILAGFTGKKR
jgi:prevent-host-death family protein